MAQRLRELVTLPEDPGSISSILHGSSQVSESPVPEFMTPEYMSHRHICRENSCPHKIKINKF